MSSYSYICPACNYTCTVDRSIHDAELVPECKDCGEYEMNRVWDVAPVHFKTGGFYKTGG